MEALRKDLRQGLRTLVAWPGFTLVVVLSLAVGIGANTMAFSVVNAVLLQPLPVEGVERLVTVYTSDQDGYEYGNNSFPDYRSVREQVDAFQDVVASQTTIANWNREAGSELVFGEVVTGNYLRVLGVEPSHGRGFRPEEDATPGTHPVAILGHGFWERNFGADPGAVGETLRLNGTAFTIVGVAPEEFDGALPVFSPDFWVPMAMQQELGFIPGENFLEQRGTRAFTVIGRLEEGATVEEARRQVEIVGRRLAEAYPGSNEGRAMTVIPTEDVRFHPFIDRALTPMAGLLMGVVGLVLLIACANVANLLLARASVRGREIAVRLALGAGRFRLVRQLLTESVLLAVAGGVLGLLFTVWAHSLLLAVQPPLPASLAVELSIDWRVLAFTVAASLATGILFGLAPALRSTRPDLATALKDEGLRGGGGLRRFSLRNVLVVVQVAVSMVLLVAAGLFLRSLANARSIEKGFESEGVALVSTILQMADYGPDRIRQFVREVAGRVEDLPGVRSASFSDRVPLDLTVSTVDYTIEGWESATGDQSIELDQVNVGPGWFETFRVPVVAGRDFETADDRGAPPVAIVNQAFARRFWPGESPLGKRISEEGAGGPWFEVVGLVDNHKIRSLGEVSRPIVYRPFLQQDELLVQTLLARTDEDAGALVGRIRRLVLEMDPDAVFFQNSTMEENLSVTLFPVRLGAVTMGVFGALALALAAVGLYGVIAYAVSRRTHEIGVRMALGADARRVVAMVIGQGMTVVCVGLGLGLLVAWAVTRLASNLLYGIGAADPLTFGVTALVLLAVALVANAIPARRGARVDPLCALRSE